MATVEVDVVKLFGCNSGDENDFDSQEKGPEFTLLPVMAANKIFYIVKWSQSQKHISKQEKRDP